jgi:pimeloyl-ACP methyl ester carboxylesterase
MLTSFSREKLLECETALLHTTCGTATSADVAIGEGEFIHTITCLSSAAEKCPLVLWHGFGMAAGSFCLNLEHLSKNFSEVHSLDWLGCGLSSRGEFTAKTVEEAEAYMIDSLEKWRQAQNIEKVRSKCLISPDPYTI